MNDECLKCPASLACVTGTAKFFYKSPTEMIVHTGVGGYAVHDSEMTSILVHFRGKRKMDRCPKCVKEILKELKAMSKHTRFARR